MSSSTARKSNSKDYITRRVRDKDGNIIVKRYKRRSSGLNIQIPWVRLPSIVLGGLFGLYAYVINMYRTGTISRLDLLIPNLGAYLQYYFDQIIGVTALFLTGIIAVGLATFLSWALITRGFKIKKYGLAARQLIAVIAITLLFSAIFSAFINEAGITRQQENPFDNNDQYDLSKLSAPFYSELLEGLLDLIGNIDDPSQIMANIAPADSQPFDHLEDTYLWRWLIAETYGTQTDPFDFVKGYENYQAPYSDANPATFDNIYPGAETRTFNVSQQYWAVTSGYQGETINTWNSLLDSQVDTSSVNLQGSGPTGDVSITSNTTLTNINSQPVFKASLSGSGSIGYLDYLSYFIQDDKQAILQNSFSYQDVVDGIDNGTFDSEISQSRFGDLSKAGGLSAIWANDSLPIYYGTGNADYGSPIAFDNKVADYLSDAQANDLSVYDVVLRVSNDIQNAIISMFQDLGPDVINPSSEQATQYEAPEGTDRAYYFWNQVQQGDYFGLKDAFAGFTNLLRAMEIPARPILGFSAGDVNSTNIQLRMEHIHVWIEALIPWDDNGITRYSWGTFNPLPSKAYLEEGEFVYGQNSLGGEPEIEVEPSSGTVNSIPSQEVGNLTEFSLAQLGAPFDFGARIKYDGLTAAGQTLTLRILNEQEINDASSATSFDTNVGTELGKVTTSSDPGNWANVSLLVGNDGSVTFTDEDGLTTDLNITIGSFNFAGTVNDRNIYAIVAQFGLSYSYFAVGWSLEANMIMAPTSAEVLSEAVTVTDPGIYSENTFNSIYSFVGENLEYEINVTSPEGDPLVGQDMVFYFLNPDQVSNIENLIQNNNLPTAKGSATTDGAGTATFSYKIQAGDISPSYNYYSILALIQPDNYAIVNIHITDEFLKVAGFNLVNDGDYIINSGETVQWTVDYSVLVNDSVLATIAGGGISGRSAYGLPVEYYILKESYFNSNNGSDASLIAALGACSSNYGDFASCYQLANVSSTASMGVLSNSVTSSTSEIINLIGGVVSANTYLLVAYLPGQNLIYQNHNQVFAFFPSASPFNADTINFNYVGSQLPEMKQNQDNLRQDSAMGSWMLKLLLAMTIVATIKQVTFRREELL